MLKKIYFFALLLLSFSIYSFAEDSSNKITKEEVQEALFNKTIYASYIDCNEKLYTVMVTFDNNETISWSIDDNKSSESAKYSIDNNSLIITYENENSEVREISKIVKDNYINISYNNVDYDTWYYTKVDAQQNPQDTCYSKSENISSNDISAEKKENKTVTQVAITTSKTDSINTDSNDCKTVNPLTGECEE